jgi:prepilin-type N-terminal cleavage/methylation domain-containing protein
MTLLKAYLSTPRAQRALTTKPGEQGFSLIELVVVVAVLAILSAIAIPQFSNISASAAHAAATGTLATVAKECAVNHATNTAATHAVITGGNNIHLAVSDAGRSCGTSAAPETVCAFVNAPIGAAASAVYCIDTNGIKYVGATANTTEAIGAYAPAPAGGVAVPATSVAW